MAKAGDKFHKLVEQIERVVAENKNITIASHVSITDKVAQNPREHDIVLSYDDGHHKFKLAIECKDWNKKIDQPVVEGFITKLRNTGIEKGIIVSSLGFSKNAIKTAQNEGVECWSLTEAEAFDWCIAPGIEEYVNELTYVFLAVDTQERTGEKFKLYQRSKGNDIEINRDNLLNFALQIFRKVNAPPAEEERKFSIGITDKDNFYIITESGEKQELERLTLIVKYKTNVRLIPFSFHDYRDEGEDKTKKQIALSKIKLGAGKTGKLIIAHDEEKGANVSIVCD